MAFKYVRSLATGTGDGSSWTNAFTTLAAALTASAAGDDVYVSEDHAETGTAGNTCTSPGTATTPCRVICVNHAGSVPPVAADVTTGASVTTTGTAGAITLAGYAFCVGVTFNCGTGTTGSISLISDWDLKNCQMNLLNSSANNAIRPTNTNRSKVVWDNVTTSFAGTGQGMFTSQNCEFEWKNTASAIGGTAPTQLNYNASTNLGTWTFRGVDLSGLSGKTLLGTVTGGPVRMRLYDCKIPASWTPFSIGTSQTASDLIMSRCDSGGTNYQHAKYDFWGSQVVETTVVRTGGASDQTTSISWKIVTNANAKWYKPFTSLPIEIWNDTTAANRTVTLYGIWDNAGGVPNNDDIFVEIDYLGSATSPIATVDKQSTKANALATGTALTSDTSTWGGTLTNPQKFKIAVTLSSPQPAQKGPFVIRVYAAKASSTFYIDPKPVLS